MPSSNGLSLNASLHTIPKIQQDMVLILIRWRCYKYVFVSDEVEMFRQILLYPLDRDWLQIVMILVVEFNILNFVPFHTAQVRLYISRSEPCANFWRISFTSSLHCARNSSNFFTTFRTLTISLVVPRLWVHLLQFVMR